MHRLLRNLFMISTQKRSRMKQVTIEEARGILENEAEKMSDVEVQSLIDYLSLMAKWALEEAARLRVQDTSSTTKRSKNDSTEV